MKKMLKVILIVWLIVIGLFFVGIIVYGNLNFEYEDNSGFYQPQIAVVNDSCLNVSFEIIINDSS